MTGVETRQSGQPLERRNAGLVQRLQPGRCQVTPHHCFKAWMHPDL
jgi:hypothetical protein